MIGVDKVGKPTGPGDGSFLVTDQDVPGSVVFEFLLFNYNIDGNLLKNEHKTLLDEHIVSFLKENRFHAELIGTASRTGAADYNRQLSLERVYRVRQYLIQKGLTDAQVPISDMKAVGEDRSTSKFDEDALERSVRIRIVVGVRPVPVLPHVVVPQIVPPQGPKPPAPPQILPEVVIKVDNWERWAIQELSGFNVGVSCGVNIPFIGVGGQGGVIQYNFLLYNRKTRQTAQCRYVGGALGAGVSLDHHMKIGRKPSCAPGMSMTQASHTWDLFHTKAGTVFDDFAGDATWVEPASLALGTNISAKARLTFIRLGVTVYVSTGHTIGNPGSLGSLGDFHLKPPFPQKP